MMAQDHVIGGNRILVDASTHALLVIGYEHHEIHDGRGYVIGTYDADLDTDDELIIAFKTPDTLRYLHVLVDVENTVAGLFEILEGATITNGTGSDLQSFNANRNSSNVSGILNIEASPTAGKASKNPTITDDGTAIWQEILGATKQQGALSSGGGRHEFVLAPNTIYAFRLTGNADNGIASIDLSWYEHIDKE